MKGVFRFVGLSVLPLALACGSAPVAPAPGAFVPASTAASTSIEERYRFGVEARLKAGLGFGYAAAIRENGRTTLVASGRRTLEPVRPLGARDLLEIGSVSKTFTGILLHLAEIEGKLGLDRRLDESFAELKGTDAGAIRVRDLGLHRSGLPSYPEGIPLRNPDDPWRGFRKDEFLEALAKFRRPSLPEGKTAYERAYSNWGYMTLGLLLERAYRKPFRELVASRVLAPLRMTDSGVDVKTRGKRGKTTPKVAPGFDLGASPVGQWEFDGFAAAAGGIESNARDMGRFLEALATPPRGKLGEAIAAALKSGIGWDSRPDVAGPAWKNGMTGAFAAFLAFRPEIGSGIFVATNTMVSPDELAEFAIGAAPNDRLLARAAPARAVEEEELARLKGRYRNPKPDAEPTIPLRTIEVAETLGRLVARYDFGIARASALVAPAAEEDEWNVTDGIVNADALRLTRGGIRATVTTASGKTVEFELEKLPAATEAYPAME